jgi:hypothetical protein
MPSAHATGHVTQSVLMGVVYIPLCDPDHQLDRPVA